jgi:flagellar basal-body rod protein FlgG
MLRALWSSASGMTAQQMNIDNISNNLANVNTASYKKSSIEFQDLMYQTNRAAGASTGSGGQIPTGIQFGHGSRVVATAKQFVQGSLQATGTALDVAIEGDGFYEVTQADGSSAYTRDGSFKINSSGEIVTSDGLKVKGLSTIPQGASAITIGNDGAFSVVVNGTSTTLSPFTLTRFPNPSGLKNVGRNLYTQTESSGTPETGGTPGQNGYGTLAQGFIEQSNVEIVQEMVNMIVAQRAYETNSKAIQAADEMLGQTNNLRR